MNSSKFRDFLPGTLLKFVSFSGRFVFLIMVLPGLAAGELAQYAFLATLSLLMARLAAMGLEDHLPLEIRGDRKAAGKIMPAYGSLLNLVLACGLVALVSGTSVPAVLFLAIVYLAQMLLSGVVRSVNPLGYEVLANLHWVLFPVFCLALSATSAEGIVGLMAISVLLNQFIVIKITRLRLAIPSTPFRDLLRLYAPMKNGWQKCLSGFTTLANMRSLILWPKFLGKTQAIDSLAFALLCAEAIWQLGMVVVNRKYAGFCLGSRTVADRLRDAIESSVLLVTVFVCAAVMIYVTRSWLGVIGDFPFQLIATVTGMFGFAAGYLLLRYFNWSAHGFSWKLTGLEVGLFLSEGLIVSLSEQSAWAEYALISFGMLYVTALTITVLDTNRTSDDQWSIKKQDITTL